jgi:transposase-like protein
MSTRDVEDTLVDEEGRSYLSKSAVSRITDSLNAEFEAFQKRDLSGLDVVYLFVDGVYEALRFETTGNEAVLCGWAILANGQKTLLHLALGNKESYDSWLDFFRQMLGRGLRQPLLINGDGAPGLIKAINDCFPLSKRQRCIAHKLRNIAGKLPQSAIAEVMPQMRAIFYAVNREVAELTAKQVVEKYGDLYPAAVNCLQDDLKACLNFLDFPYGHHRFIRTTNLLERAFGEEKRRTKTIPKFPTEKSGLKLVFGTLIRVSKKWQRVQMSDFDLALLKKLRKLQAPKALEEASFISWKMTP